jgi:hypothetical protein
VEGVGAVLPGDDGLRLLPQSRVGAAERLLVAARRDQVAQLVAELPPGRRRTEEEDQQSDGIPCQAQSARHFDGIPCQAQSTRHFADEPHRAPTVPRNTWNRARQAAVSIGASILAREVLKVRSHLRLASSRRIVGPRIGHAHRSRASAGNVGECLAKRAWHGIPSSAWRNVPGTVFRYTRFSGFRGFSAFGTNRPSFRTSLPSNQISPPPQSGVWISTRSQWTSDLLPFGASS